MRSGDNEEYLQSTVIKEGGEELLEDGVGDVLHLRGHAESLSADIHGEDFCGPNPSGCSPCWLVEEDEEEEEEGNGDADREGFRGIGDAFDCIVYCWGLGADDCDDQHARGHTASTDDEEEFAPEAVDSPGCVKREENSKGGVQGVD